MEDALWMLHKSNQCHEFDVGKNFPAKGGEKEEPTTHSSRKALQEPQIYCGLGPPGTRDKPPSLRLKGPQETTVPWWASRIQGFWSLTLVAV